ncbi:membrane protein [Brucella anthropi]|uniref:membrane protein n=1 Tax=Brucella anthropi TaxID=529 RepID=UPI000449AF59|nr:membrane protein [Brucella anthropi]EXL07433.1 membrane protein [Brucella anthropi]RRY13324.1 hypothetical protein EGJ58_03190 [Brucella anthropi]
MDKTVPAGAALLLDFIYRTDAGKAPPHCYQVIFGNRQKHLPQPITQMTLGDLIDAQKNWSSKAWVKKNWGYGTASSAVGAAQFMRATLQDLAKELGLKGTQIFSADLQDRLAFHLLKRRGYEDFMGGKITRTEFGKRLAQEWASLPVLSATRGAHRDLVRGESYYSGDELNKALVAPAEVEAILDKVKAAGTITASPKALPADIVPQASTGFWANLFKFISSFFGKGK